MDDAEVYQQLMSFINEQVPFARYCGVEVTELAESGATATLPDAPTLLNHVKTQHAGALFTVAESASGACMLGLVGERFSSITPLVRSSTISYRRAAKGLVTATAQSDAQRAAVYEELSAEGRCDFTVRVQLHDNAGELVATAEMAWHVRARDGQSDR
jgi:acyl-coenzyme A thioesterase PaaI-like protein